MSGTVYAYNHCARYAELPKLTEVLQKTPKKTRYVGSRSLKVIEFGTQRTGTYDCLLVTISNFGYSSHAFRATAM